MYRHANTAVFSVTDRVVLAPLPLPRDRDVVLLTSQAEGAPFIRRHIIMPAKRSFDDFAGGAVDRDQLRRILGSST